MNNGRWQTVAAVLGVAGAVLAGVIIVMVLADPPAPAPTASPTSVAVGSPSPGLGSPTIAPTAAATATATSTSPPTEAPTAAPTEAPTAAPTEAPTVAPTVTTEPTAPPTVPATAAPTPTAPPTPAQAVTPLREIRFTGVGLEAPDAPEEPSARYFTFTTGGPGQISALISNVTAGRVRMCLWRGGPQGGTDTECRNVRNGGVERAVADVAETRWTVSLIGATEQVSPTATLLIRFPTFAPRLEIERFRFAGEAIENYNGFVAEIDAAATGDLTLTASWENEEDERYPYRMLVEEIGSPAAPFMAEGSHTTATDHTAPLVLGRSYRVTFANSVEVAEGGVYLRASLSWP
jgi:hypothetical protein